jgi:hypothetical protein
LNLTLPPNKAYISRRHTCLKSRISYYHSIVVFWISSKGGVSF